MISRTNNLGSLHPWTQSFFALQQESKEQNSVEVEAGLRGVNQTELDSIQLL